jgi:Rps23 Pro-64 3,4-dihydroxylase Tpa1-like proline 4-hydroxylase
MAPPQFRLNPALDADELARAFSERGRLHIPDFLVPADAEQLLAALEASVAWNLIVNQGEKVVEFNRSAQASLSPEQAMRMNAVVYAGAQRGFQYRYETIKAPHADADRAADPTALNSFARFMSSEAVISFLRRVTGTSDITFADAQATAYSPGHFLTSHDDLAPKQKRQVAYVFNLTKEWRVEWGGLLTFHDGNSKVAEALIPAFNALNLFAVPQLHSVSFVAPFAARRRYSVTGWLRAGTPP